MPFQAYYLSPDEVDAEYESVLRHIEMCELKEWLKRVVDPSEGNGMEKCRMARESVAEDWADTKRLRSPEAEVT